MKALTSSCSKAIVETLGPFSPRVSLIRVSDRPEFCFTLRSRNDRKGCNLLLLKLVQKKGLYPVHAVPPKDQVDLETPELQAPQSEQTNELKFVRVAFQIQKDCDFGEHFLIVGDDPILGSWDPLEALPMTWSEGHVWAVELDIPAGKSIQFKFILKGKDGNIIWQPGPDRVINIQETMNRTVVCEDWENVELQKIIEEDQVAPPNEEGQFVSEVLTNTEILDKPQEELDSNAPEISAVEETQIHAEEEPLVEDTQILAEEEPLAEPDQQEVTGISSSMEKPKAIVAENISSFEDLIKSTSHESDEKNILQPSEESADSPLNDDIIHDLGHNGNDASLENHEETVVESSLFDIEVGPALVPGLIIPPTGPTDEASQSEVQEIATKDTSVGALETQDQNIPEFSKEQELDDASPQVINANINNEPEQVYNEHEESHLSQEMEDKPNHESDDDSTLQNDIKWGHETVKKFLTKLGFI
ncbi:hypothetical protein VNO78_25999 [Psophocarpus tetragonolobus]|uniref:CBM20 domain-containing protein n=1 Tax=Psophocarpus tetragonolobus TaxID=3891 RepID=A0AAN9S7D1_PSOTE